MDLGSPKIATWPWESSFFRGTSNCSIAYLAGSMFVWDRIYVVFAMTYCWHPKWLTCFSFAYADRHIPFMFRNLEAQWESSNLLFVNVKKLLACQVLMLLPTIMLVTCKSYLNVPTEMQLSAFQSDESALLIRAFFTDTLRRAEFSHKSSLEISKPDLKTHLEKLETCEKKWTKWKVVYPTI